MESPAALLCYADQLSGAPTNLDRPQPQKTPQSLHHHNHVESDRKRTAGTLDSTDKTYANNYPVDTLSSALPAHGSSLSGKKAQLPKGETWSKFSQWISDWLTDWWGMELICWLIAALSLLTIVVIVEVNKNNPLP